MKRNLIDIEVGDFNFSTLLYSSYGQGISLGVLHPNTFGLFQGLHYTHYKLHVFPSFTL